MAFQAGLAKQPWVGGLSAPKREPRFAPSLDGLRAFEVAARHLSFTRAAAELCVTQGAVSQPIKALEHEPRFVLFDRRKTGLVLTSRGRCLTDGIRSGLEQITRTMPLPVVPTAYAYYFVCSPESAEDRRVLRFRNWLLSEIGDLSAFLVR